MADEITVVMKGRDETLGSTLSGVEKDMGGVANAAKSLAKETDKAEDSFKKTDSAGGKLAGVLGNVGQIAGGFVVGQAILKGPGLMMDMANSAASLELQQKKTNTVFGEATGIVSKWAEENARSMGLTGTQAATLATNLGDLLVPMGMTREAAAEMATKTIGLAGALSEWSGGTKSAAEVSDILTKAYLGETDGLKSLGIAISAADIDARLLAKGQKELTGEALSQAKALAIQEMVFEKSSDAQTAFANGAGTAARKQAELKADMAAAREELAMALAPAITAVTQLIATAAVPAFQLLGVGIGLLGAAAEKVGPAFSAMQPFFAFLAENMDIIGPAIGGVAAVILASMVPAALAWAAAEAVKTAALLASAAAFIVANAPLIAIAAGVGLLVVGIMLLVKHWDEIVAKVPALGVALDVVKKGFELFMGGVETAISFVKSNWQLLGAIILAPFLPLVIIATDMFGIRSKIQNGVMAALDFVRDNWKLIATIISGPFAPLVFLATDMFGVRTAIQNGVTGAISFVKGGVGEIVGFITGIPGAITGVVGAVTTAATNLGKGIVDGIASGIKGVAGALSGLGTDLREALRSAVNSALRWLSDTVKISIPGFDPPGPGPSIPGFTWSFPAIQFAKGGLVPGSGSSDTVPAFLTPGEFVLTRQQTQSLMSARAISAISGGGRAANVYHIQLNLPNYLGSKTEVAREVLKELRRGGVAV